MKSIVSLTKSSNHFDGVRNSCELLRKELKSAVSKTYSVVIKVNFVDTRVELSTTPFEAVKSFILFIREFYKGNIIIAEGATWGTKIDAFAKFGYKSLTKEDKSIQLLDLNYDKTINKKIKFPKGEFNVPVCKTIIDAPLLVSIVRPKTHNRVVITASLKNVLVGSVPGYKNRLKLHKGKYIHHVLTSIAKHSFLDFVIIDGTVGMEGDGPVGKGTRKEANWVISSFDALAADSLAAYLMGFDINDIGYLNLLYENNYGNLFPGNKIKILGEAPEGLVNPFKPHKNFERQKKWRVRGICRNAFS